MKKIFGIVLALCLTAALAAPLLADNEETVPTPPRPAGDSEKLDLILNKLDEIRAELQIVKIRATQK